MGALPMQQQLRSRGRLFKPKPSQLRPWPVPLIFPKHEVAGCVWCQWAVVGFVLLPVLTGVVLLLWVVWCRYGHEHAAVELQKEAVYGLTELHREEVKGARLLANPGCYPTCTQVGVRGRGGRLERGGCVNAWSGEAPLACGLHL